MIGDVSHDGLSVSILPSELSAVDFAGLFGGSSGPCARLEKRLVEMTSCYHVDRSRSRCGASCQRERSRGGLRKRMLCKTSEERPRHTRTLRGHTGPNVTRDAIRYNEHLKQKHKFYSTPNCCPSVTGAVQKVHRADTGALKYTQPKPLQPVSGAP